MSNIEQDQVEMNEESEDLTAITTTEILNRVNALIKLQEQADKLEEQKEPEYEAIHNKYKPLFEEILKIRASIISGETEPTDIDSAPKEPLTISELPSNDIKGIPNFWLGVLTNFPYTKDLLAEEDEPVLSHLINIAVADDEETGSFTVQFVFSPNEYFTNTSITAAVAIEGGEIASIKVDPIEWKEGKKFIIMQVEKKIKKKGPKGKPPVVTTKIVEEKLQSIFTVLLVNSDSEDAEFKHSEDELATPEEIMQIQGGILDNLAQKVVPFAIEWFLGRGELDEQDGMGDFDMGDFDEEDLDEDDEDFPQQQAPQGRRPAGGQPPKPNNPECKQQ
ncbi:hypothetical protein SAMD00019534_092910 [Acytostelium subglobosum LB1]|uniref:hypothetical protein n=1 Tax=Acytostelium subglobosum LB1 TaxID=1410327 RepID=UPI000644D03D|nr:hypothetical protein SAMD00019534_092910 [Acytostelium subglobosum LB1]GAM26116.1 hypothetical protein SAMD00019534_092910 [Acytostelium subglobosum LB1]|eukprot:XP_012751159.1 hypothetical protein SAMD00019534_092910 [Acytostelium subglobosum LB1]